MAGMGVLDEITRLGLKLTEEDREEIRRITEYLTENKSDEIVRDTLIELHVTDYLECVRPDIMESLIKEKDREAEGWLAQIRRRYDDAGKKLCDETLCGSVEDVQRCTYCDKYVCKAHNFGGSTRCCYGCWKEHLEGKS
jgi:hypothetical protein